MKQEKKVPRPSRKLQHLHFAAHSASRNTVIVHLSNGTRLTGIVLASDNYMILLGKTGEDPSPTVVYKRAITVVTPAHAAGPVVQDTWVTDGTVASVVRAGDTVYFGGAFSFVGPATGMGALLNCIAFAQPRQALLALRFRAPRFAPSPDPCRRPRAPAYS